MNKSELINYVMQNTGLTKTDASNAVDSVFAAISKSLAAQDDVRLVGFGTFFVSDRRATKGRNPRTGEEIDIPAARTPKFKAGQALKNAVDNKTGA